MKRLDISKYGLFIFDWDGALADSLGTYRELDKLFVKEFYGVERPVADFYEMSSRIKTGAVNGSENDYYRYLDGLFGDGKTSLELIWENIYKLAPKVQATIDYKLQADLALKELRARTTAPIALATSSGIKDILFFSSNESATAKKLRPMDYFDKIVTFDDVANPKPHPESFEKVISYYRVAPEKTLIFEDSLSGAQAAKTAGADVAIIYDKHSDKDRAEIEELMDYYFEKWQDFIKSIQE